MLSGASSAELFICREADASSSGSEAPNLKLNAYGQCMAVGMSWPQRCFAEKLERSKCSLEQVHSLLGKTNPDYFQDGACLVLGAGLKPCSCLGESSVYGDVSRLVSQPRYGTPGQNEVQKLAVLQGSGGIAVVPSLAGFLGVRLLFK